MSTAPSTAPEPLTVGVVGLGYLGAVHAAGMAALGHRVVGYDVDPRKVDALSRAQAPFFEPGLEELLAETQGEKLLFTHDVTDHATAELVKVAANSFLATKISFINAMAEVAEAAGADVETLADAIGYDDRIRRKFLNAGLGFGGGCLPKDIRAFMARAGELGAD